MFYTLYVDNMDTDLFGKPAQLPSSHKSPKKGESSESCETCFGTRKIIVYSREWGPDSEPCPDCVPGPDPDDQMEDYDDE